MSVRSAVLRSLLVVVAGGFSAAGKVTGGVADRSPDEDVESAGGVTPPGPLGPRASAGRRAVVTGVGPGPELEGDD